MNKGFKVVYRFHTAQRRAPRKLTTRSHSNYGMANTPDLLPTVTTLKGLRVRLGIATKETHWNRLMAISMLSIRTNPSHQALHTKVKLHDTPEQGWILTTGQKSWYDLPKMIVINSNRLRTSSYRQFQLPGATDNNPNQKNCSQLQ